MKVLHVTNLYPYPGNPIYGIFIKEQVCSLDEVAIDTEVLFINAQGNGKLAYFTAISKIRKKAKDFDIIHCHHSYSSLVTLSLARVKKPVVTSFLNVLGGEGHLGIIEKLINKTIVSSSSAIIVKNDSDIGLKLPNKGYYIPNGVNMSFFEPMTKASAFEKLALKPGKYVLFVSGGNKYRDQKRYDIFSEVINILNEHYKADVQELCLINTHRELVPYYFNASVLHLLTSDFEGSPNSVKEALACNVPVVSTDVGNVKNMIEDIDGCYLSPSNDPKVLAELTMKVLQNESEFTGRQALYNKKLDTSSVALKIKEVYKKVLNN